MNGKWQEIALEQIDKPSEALSLIASTGIAGVITFFVGTPIIGVVALAIGVAYTIGRGEVATKQEEAILQHGCYPISLKSTRLQEYIQEVGAKQVATELSWAVDRGYRLSDTPDDWLEAYLAGKNFAFEQEAIPLSEYRIDFPVSTTTTAVTDTLNLNNDQVESLKKNSIFTNEPTDKVLETDAQRLERIFEHPTTETSSAHLVDRPKTILLGDRQVEEDNFNLIDSILENLSSMLFLAMPGCGKGMLVSNLLTEFKKRNPKSVIVVIDPKGSKKEVGYWDGVADILWRKQIKYLESAEKVQWIKDGWRIFENECIKSDGDYPVLVFLDEMLAVGMEFGAKDTFLQSKIKDIVSMGPSEQAYCWIATQSPAVADLGISSAIGNQLKKVIIAKREYSKMMKAWMANRYPLLGGFDFTPIDKYIEASPVGRAVLFEVDGKWRPMEKMTNNSGYDRDSKTYANPDTVVIPEVIQTLPLVKPTPPMPLTPDCPTTPVLTETPAIATDNFHPSQLPLQDSSTEETILYEQDEQLNLEQAILAFFDAAKEKSPKPLNIIRNATSMRKFSNISRDEFLASLDNLVAQEILECPAKDVWSPVHWQLSSQT